MEGLTPMETALMLMCIGMGTVFIILILIIWLSNGLIQVINKVAPEEEAPAKKVAAAPAAISANVELPSRRLSNKWLLTPWSPRL